MKITNNRKEEVNMLNGRIVIGYKLNIGFNENLKNIREVTNRTYRDYNTMTQVIEFYAEHGLLKDTDINIEVVYGEVEGGD